MRYLHRSDHERCQADITLKDGSAAQCQRYRTKNSRFCMQHTKMLKPTYKVVQRTSYPIEHPFGTWQVQCTLNAIIMSEHHSREAAEQAAQRYEAADNRRYR